MLSSQQTKRKNRFDKLSIKSLYLREKKILIYFLRFLSAFLLDPECIFLLLLGKSNVIIAGPALLALSFFLSEFDDEYDDTIDCCDTAGEV